MFDDIIGNQNKPCRCTPYINIKVTKGEVAETNTLGYILIIYVDPANGKMYYLKYITKEKFNSGDEVEIVFEDLNKGPHITQICERWTIDNKTQDDICVEEVRKVKK